LGANRAADVAQERQVVHAAPFALGQVHRLRETHREQADPQPALERSAQTDVGGKCHGDHDVWQTKGSRSTRAVRYPARWLNVGAHATNTVDGVSAAAREHPFEQVEVLLEVSWREKQVSGPDPR